jgi:hypothetical protein
MGTGTGIRCPVKFSCTYSIVSKFTGHDTSDLTPHVNESTRDGLGHVYQALKWALSVALRLTVDFKTPRKTLPRTWVAHFNWHERRPCLTGEVHRGD